MSAEVAHGELLPEPNDPAYSALVGDLPQEWPAHTLSALAAWSQYPGSYFDAATRPQEAPIIALLDTGIDMSHPDFLNPGAAGPDVSQGGQLLLSVARSFRWDSPDPSDIVDECGRGTHLAGIIAAAANNGVTAGSGLAGLAYPARLLPLRVTDEYGFATLADIAAAIIYAADQGAAVILIGPQSLVWSRQVQDAVDYAWNHGCLLVAPIGSSGDSTPSYPGSCPHVFGVGATTADGVVAGYSCTGDGLALVAPGGDASVGVYSLLPTYPCVLRTDPYSLPYGYAYGTEFAAAHVAAAAALYAGAMGLRPETGDEGARIWQALQQATGTGEWTPNRGYGAPSLAQLVQGTASSEPGAGSIVGRVLLNGSPAVGAEIAAIPSAGGPASVATAAWPTGAYRIANLPSGLYDVTATSGGKTAIWQRVRVSPGCDTPAVDFLLGSESFDADAVAASIPGAAVRGKSLELSATFRNAGLTDWTRAKSIYLTADGESAAWEGIQVGLRPAEVVPSGGTTTFALSLPAPDACGFYQLSLRLRQQGGIGSFGEAVEATISVTSFLDVPADFWAVDAIEAAKAAGIVGGYAGDVYLPQGVVTRDQMAVFIARALAGGEANVPTGPATPNFPDVPADHWAYRHIEYVRQQGVASGYWDGYHPGDSLDRAQMAVFVARAMAGGEEALASYTPPETPSFPDVPADFWSYKYVEYLRQAEVVGGYWDGLYHPELLCTRDQMAVFVARAFGL